MSIGATVIELYVFNKKEKKKINMDKMEKTIFCYKFGQNWIGIQLSFDMCCTAKSFKVEET